jgi:hypothetical protein
MVSTSSTPAATSSYLTIATPVASRPHTRSKSGVYRPKERTDGTVAWLATCLDHVVVDPTPEPCHFFAAMQIPH